MKKQRLVAFVPVLLLGIFLVGTVWAGTTGKIVGVVLDKSSGEPLPGANISIVGTTLGAAADINGNYTILHIPPGVYELQVSVIGFATLKITDVRVTIDQTTRQNMSMEMETLEGETVTVVAEKDIMREDVATSVVAVTAQEVEELPVSSISSVVGLQAGIQGGMQIRGGGADEALFLMDGITLRDPRNNRMVSNIPLSSVQELTIERGGFNAEYGQARSGIVNVVTREGSKTGYYGNLEFKYSPPAAKHFGISPFDENSNWLRPYYDEDVCWTGTTGEDFVDENNNQYWDEGESYTDYNGDGQWTGWDRYTQRQYPDFAGWNAISDMLMSDSDPDNDLSPQQAQRVFSWETRKEPVLDQPDYNIDAGFGGPVPVIGKQLGDLRFFTAYRRNREMLLVPLTRDDYVDYDWTMKLISDITPSMKLMVSGLVGKQYTMQQNWSYNYLRYPSQIVGLFEDRPGRLFGTGAFSLADIAHQSFSAKLTHTLSPKTLYEVSVEHFRRSYETGPGRRRSEDLYELFPDYFVTEAPYGYDPTNEAGITGMLFGGHTSKRRDSTLVSSTTLKADLVSQINNSNEAKIGFEFAYNDLDLDFGNASSLSDGTVFDERVQMHLFPYRASLYVQDKLETKGFTMNAGLRLDYSNSNTEWWDVDPFNQYFFSTKYNNQLEFEMSEAKSQWQLSPRLGISHPITETTKLYFNYGHFKQVPSYETLFRIGRASSRRMTIYGDPDLILAKTVSYELGVDQALKNDIILQVSAYYKDISDQQDSTRYTSFTGVVYDRTTSNSYEDIRGFEVTLRKNRGRWWNFFANYTYEVSSSGHFGREYIYEDPSEQKKYDEQTTNLYEERPIPAPYARVSLSLYTPDNYGPNYSGFNPFGGYLANLILDWRAGSWVDYNPKNVSSIGRNVQETNHFNAILRISKTFRINRFRIQAFMDIDNLFNYKRMSLANFMGKGGDYDYYMSSLHLPKSDAYDNIPGDDRVGSYRKDDVAYQPMFNRGQIDYEEDTGDVGVIYYDKATSRYVEYGDNGWADVEKGRLDKILDDKAYIDMPNQDSFTFLDPRQIYFGVRVSFDLD